MRKFIHTQIKLLKKLGIMYVLSKWVDTHLNNNNKMYYSSFIFEISDILSVVTRKPDEYGLDKFFFSKLVALDCGN